MTVRKMIAVLPFVATLTACASSPAQQRANANDLYVIPPSASDHEVLAVWTRCQADTTKMVLAPWPVAIAEREREEACMKAAGFEKRPVTWPSAHRAAPMPGMKQPW